MIASRYCFLICASVSAVFLLLCCNEANAQTAADIESVVRSSKYIDNTRPVRAVIDAKEVTISTYAHPKASDQDCKINALFIMKEMLQHFRTVHRMRINFFDQRDPNRYRQVAVSEGDTALVDGGKPVKEVLAQLPLTNGKIPAKNAARGNNLASQSSMASWVNASAKTKMTNFMSNDGDVTMLLPEGPSMQGSDGQTIVRSITAKVQTMLVRYVLANTTYDDAVRNCEFAIMAYKDWHKTKEGPQSVKGYQAIYYEGTFEPASRLRAIFIHGRDHIYILTLTAKREHDNDVEEIFKTMVSSINIKG